MQIKILLFYYLFDTRVKIPANSGQYFRVDISILRILRKIFAIQVIWRKNIENRYDVIKKRNIQSIFQYTKV